MSGNLRIGWRFLTADKRALAMSLGGIVFGVGFFVVTQAQTSGFERLFIRTILGTNGAIRVEDRFQDTLRSLAAPEGGGGFAVAHRESRRYIEGVEEPHLLREALGGFSGITGVSEVVAGGVRIEASGREDEARVFGVRLEDHLRVSDLAERIRDGSLQEFREQPTGAVVGATLARRLQVRAGDTVRVEFRGATRPYRVSAVFETGVSDIDRTRVYLHLAEAKSLLQRPFGASFLQVGLGDPAEAPRLAARIEEITQHHAASWQERERTWLEVFGALRISSAVTVTCIIVIAGMGIFNALATQVLRKTREIAILRSMGYTRADIAAVFLWQGVFVIVAGLMAGWAVGAAGTALLARVPIRIRGILAADTFVVHWSPWHYVAGGVAAAVAVLVASWVPARRAARMEPAGIIRGASQ